MSNDDNYLKFWSNQRGELKFLNILDKHKTWTVIKKKIKRKIWICKKRKKEIYISEDDKAKAKKYHDFSKTKQQKKSLHRFRKLP